MSGANKDGAESYNNENHTKTKTIMQVPQQCCRAGSSIYETKKVTCDGIE